VKISHLPQNSQWIDFDKKNEGLFSRVAKKKTNNGKIKFDDYHNCGNLRASFVP